MMRKSTNFGGLLGGAVLLAVLSISPSASATHKTWELRESGTSCVGTAPSSTPLRYTGGAVLNTANFSASVVCPVTLAGKFANTAGGLPGPFPVAEWAAAGYGQVYVFDGSSSAGVSCGANVRTATGSTYFSRNVASSTGGTGATQLDIYGPTGGGWGGTLGFGGMSIRAFGYRCVVPTGSMIYGYRVNLCQYGSSNLASKCDP